MWIKNAWYVAAWAKDIQGSEPFARTILGEPIVFYRTTDGSVTALEDRCCHRLAPLSKGRVEDDDLRCMYHGVKFGPKGECVEIPGEPRIPKKYRVRHFPVVEKQNVIWIWMGDENLANEDDIVDYPYLDSEDWAYKGAYLPYKASYILALDNFLDFSHLPYVHENTIGAGSYAEIRPSIEKTDFGIHVENLSFDLPAAPTFQQLANFSGNVDRWSIYDVHVRGTFLLGHFGSAPVGEGGHKGDRKNAFEFRHFSAMTPETEKSSHYHFAQTRNFALDKEELDDQVIQGVVDAFYEDQVIIEAQQVIIDMKPEAPMIPLEVDKALLMFRKETDRIIAAEQDVGVAAE